MSEASPRGVFAVLAICVVLYGFLVWQAGDVSIPVRLMASWGGIMPLDWMQGEYWRFVVAGFLHFGPLHIVTNMICLLAWGIPLERLYGTVRFLLLYLASILGGTIGSVLLHEDRFVGAGASGGISGLLGALLMLTLLRRIGLPASFFLINFGLNVTVALFAPGVDWQAHLTGCLAGMAVAAILPRPRGLTERG
jgi:membrane associated rhomboid family serine protease